MQSAQSRLWEISQDKDPISLTTQLYGSKNKKTATYGGGKKRGLGHIASVIYGPYLDPNENKLLKQKL